MQLGETDLVRVESRLRWCRQRVPCGDEDLPAPLYHAYVAIFRDAGVRLAQSDRLRGLDGFLVASPSGATMVVVRNAPNRTQVFHLAHALGHLLLGHGSGRSWFILKDFSDEALASPQQRTMNREAGTLARALLNSEDVAMLLKVAIFRRLLTAGIAKPFVRDFVFSLRNLHHMALRKAPLLNDLAKALPAATAVWAWGRAAAEQTPQVSTGPALPERQP